MTTALLTFLGRVPKSEGSYRKTSYDFGDGNPSEPVSFFGWPLQKRLAADRMVIMGTAGSMWDHLFEGDIIFEQEAEEARLRLLEATEKKAVTGELLSPLQGALSVRLGCESRLVIIPYCRDEREQIGLMGLMAQHVETGDTVHIDVSHGFRHLPMIALMAALHLRIARKAQIGGIWYGAFDPDTGKAPVYNLEGLLHIADWIQSLHTYDKDGDYGVFSPLLGPAGQLLRRAAFFERTTNPVKARKELASWANRRDRFPANDPAAELFRPVLEQRISWHRKSDRASWETELAGRYLGEGDYVRAAIYGLEATISAKVMSSGGNQRHRREREVAREQLHRSGSSEFSALNKLRNALAHSVESAEPRIIRILRDEAALRSTLKRLLRHLLGSSHTIS